MRELEDGMIGKTVEWVSKEFDKSIKLVDIATEINPMFMLHYNKYLRQCDMAKFVQERHKYYTEAVQCFNIVWEEQPEEKVMEEMDKCVNIFEDNRAVVYGEFQQRLEELIKKGVDMNM